jgi:hypothetical protein
MSPRLLVLTFSAALAATAASASEPKSLVEKAFGATIVSTYPDGRTGELWLQADGAYTAQGRRGDPSSGHWNLSGGKLCLKQSHPLPVPFHFCTPLPTGGMDKSWTAKAVTGEAIRVRLLPGHVIPDPKTASAARSDDKTKSDDQ